MMRIPMLLLLLIAVTIVSVQAVQRYPLFEIFTSTTCGPCATANPLLDANYAAHENDVVYIRYHMNWPAPGNDPFYAYNSTDNYTRRLYYSISSVPTVVVDGTEYPNFSPNQYPSTTTTRLAIPARVTIAFDTTVAGQVTVTLTPETGFVFGNYVLYVAIVEDSINYTGTNGIPQHDQVMRKMLPDGNGTAVNLSGLTPSSRTLTYTLDPIWNLNQLQIVAWVQPTAGTTRPVAQAGKIHLSHPAYYFTLTTTMPAGFAARGAVCNLPALITNLGMNADNFTVSLDVSALPGGWASSYTIGGTTYNTPHSVAVASGGSQAMTINVTVGPTGSSGQVTLNALSAGNGQTRSQVFTVSPNANLLLVDDDQESPDVDAYFTACLDALGVPYNRWDHTSSGAPPAGTLATFPVVLWFTGQPYSDVLSTTDQTNLASFMDGGGRLILTGSEVGWNIGQPTPTAFYTNYLKATWLVDASSTDLLHETGDSLFNVFNIDISGGTEGSADQLYPDVIRPRAGAVRTFYYGSVTDSVGGIHIPAYHSYYFAFGLEGITSFALRRDIIEACLRHTGIILDVPGEPVPENIAVTGIHPNPSTGASYLALLAQRTNPVTIEVYDELGSLLASTEYPARIGMNRYPIGGDLVPGRYMVVVKQGTDVVQRRWTVE